MTIINIHNTNKYLRLIPIFFIGAISCFVNAQEKNTNSLLEGKWNVVFPETNIGEYRINLIFETKSNTFKAFTRKDALQDMFGNVKSLLIKKMIKSISDGAFVKINNGETLFRNDTLFIKGNYEDVLNNSGVIEAYVYDSKLRGTIYSKIDHSEIGTFFSNKEKTNTTDYSRVMSGIIDTTSKYIYDKAILNHKIWKRYKRKLQKPIHIEDDLELLIFHYFSTRKNKKFPFSHFNLIRKMEFGNGTLANTVFLSDSLSRNTGILRIKSFSGSAEEMDSVFKIILSKNYKNLIVDLRKNGGGGIASSLMFGKRVVENEMNTGVFLTRRWFDSTNVIPTSLQYTDLPYVIQPDLFQFLAQMKKEKAIVLKVIPAKEVYKGKIFVLTDKRTASTCEPLVYALKNTGRGIIVGENTAGAMLGMSFFNLSDEFILTVPTTDYFTNDGVRLDKVGVAPNFEVESDKAMKYVFENLIK